MQHGARFRRRSIPLAERATDAGTKAGWPSKSDRTGVASEVTFAGSPGRRLYIFRP